MYKQHIVLDFEMNPVQKRHAEIRKYLSREIIEIGAFRIDEFGQICDSFSCLVNPYYSQEINPFVAKLTGLRTSEIHTGLSFSEAVTYLSNWIGKEKSRIYGWGSSDLIQFRAECLYKDVEFPENMKRWIDFQKLFPRFTCLHNRQPSLHEGAEWYGIPFSCKKAHRAVYDAEITSKLLIPVLTGEYRNHTRILAQVVHEQQDMHAFSSLADSCNGILAQLLTEMNREIKYAH